MYTQKTTTATTKTEQTHKKPTGKRLRVKEDVKASSLKEKRIGQNKRCTSAKEDKKEDLQTQKITNKLGTQVLESFSFPKAFLLIRVISKVNTSTKLPSWETLINNF